MRKYFISIVLMCIFGVAFSAGVTLSGNMVDYNGNPVYSTQITLKSKTDESVKFVVNSPMPPNYTPTYKFDNVESGDYELFAFGNGSKSSIYDITIADQDMVKDIVMIMDDNMISININVMKVDVYEGVPNAKIECYMDSELKAEGITSESGNYTFWGMNAGDYKFVVTASGFTKTELEKTVSRYDNYITIRMAEDLGETVTVSGMIKKAGVDYNNIVVQIKNEETGKIFYSNASQNGTYSIANVKTGNATFKIDVPNMSITVPSGVVDVTDNGTGNFVQDISVEQTAIGFKGVAYLQGTTNVVYGTKIEVKKDGNVVGNAEVNYMGEWEINGISESGEYQITASATGYSEVEKTVNVDLETAIGGGGSPIVVETFYLTAVAIQITLTGDVTYYDTVSYSNINVEGAEVKLFNSSGDVEYGSAVSDENGRFRIVFEGFTNTTYLVKVTCSGYNDYETNKQIYSANESMYIYLTKPAPTFYPVVDFKAVQANGKVDVNLSWKLDEEASSYVVSRFTISRKTVQDTYFNQIGVVDANQEYKFTDTNVEVGEYYCYVVDVVYNNPSGIGYYSKIDPPCVTIKDPTAVAKHVVTIAAPSNGILEVKNGDVSIVSGNEVEEGTILNIKATPNDGYVLKSIMVDGVEITGDTVEVTKALEISATFEQEVVIMKYIVTIITPLNGTLEVKNGDVSINSGDEIVEGTILKLITKPNEKYVLDSLMVNGERILGDTVEVNENITISAIFKKDVGVDNLTDNVSVWCFDGTVRIEGANNAQVEVIDAMGRIVKRFYDVDDLAFKVENKGMYIVRIGTYSKKIIVY